MLTESITERVSTRTKDAKQKIERIQKSSRDCIAETTKTATNKLKSVRKNTIELTQNLSLGRKKTNVTSKPDEKAKSSVFHLDRTQSAPVNDELFSSISFYSPLNSKTNKTVNINTAESSYEIPKSVRSLSSDSIENSETADKPDLPSNPPPSYEDVIKEDNAAASERPNPVARTRRKSKTNSNLYENNVVIGPIKAAEKNLSDNDDENEYSMPCPDFPAPVLKEGIYGKIRGKEDTTDSAEASTSVDAPMRSRRQKDSGQSNAQDESDAISSTRVTVDPKEFHSADGRYSKLLSGELSEDLSEKLKLEERNIPTPGKSDSWSYYDGNSDDSSLSEPIYENAGDINCRLVRDSEPIYGVLYNSETADKNLLTPVAAARKRRSDQYAVVKKSPEVRLRNAGTTTYDILKEFDPLDRKTLDKILASKSNELKLLENILGSETYGSYDQDSNYDYNSCSNSNDTSDGDDSEEPPAIPERLDSLKECANEESEETNQQALKVEQNDLSGERRSVIVHQNVNLRSDSSENIADNVSNESGPSNTVEEKATGSRWFFGSAMRKTSTPKPSVTPKAKEEKSYVEEIEALEDKSMTPLSKTSSMKSMFTNVMNKVEGIKRKTSFRSSANKSEVKIVLEMIPRPCLTQRLILHEGHLIRLPTGVVEDILKELHSRKAYIRDRKFQAYFDKDLKTPKENIPLETITTIQCVNNHKFTHNFVDIYCFEVTTSISKNPNTTLSNPNMVITSNNTGNIKGQRVCHLYGVAKESERFLWMQKLLESMTDAFPPGFSCKFYRAGWCYSKVKIIRY